MPENFKIGAIGTRLAMHCCAALLAWGLCSSAHAQAAQDTAALHAQIVEAWRIKNAQPAESYARGHALLSASEAAGYLEGQALSLHVIADYHIRTQQLDSAAHYVMRSLPLRVLLGDLLLIARSYKMQALIAKKRMEFDKALVLNRLHIVFGVPGHNRQEVASGLAMRGDLYRLRGMRDSAMYFHELAAGMAQYPDSQASTAQVLLGLANTYQVVGQNVESLPYYRRAIDRQAAAGDVAGQAKSWNNLGSALLELGKLDSAQIAFQRAIEFQTTLNTRDNLGGYYANLALVQEQKGDWAAALESATKAVELLDGSGKYDELASAYINLGLIRSDLGDASAALTAFETAQRHAAASENPELQLRASEHLLLALASTKRYDRAYALQDSLHAARLGLEHENELARSRSRSLENDRKVLAAKIVAQENAFRARLSGLSAVAALLLLTVLTTWFVRDRSQRAALAATQQRQLQREFQSTLFLKELDTLYARIEASQETRATIARDLHDDVKNELAMARNYLQKVSVPLEPIESERFIKGLDLLTSNISKIKDLAARMHDASRINPSLQEAVSEIAAHIQATGKLAVSCLLPDVPLPTDRLWVGPLAMVVRELSMNVLNHARATELTINLHHKDGNLSISVEDNGTGFNEAEAERGTGQGLRNIRERIALLRGNITYDTGRGGGTTVLMDIPVPHH